MTRWPDAAQQEEAERLDQQIAAHYFGFRDTGVVVPGHAPCTYWTPPQGGNFARLPPYSGDIMLAWELVGKLRSDGWWLSLSVNDYGTEPWDCRMVLKEGERTEKRAIAHGATAPLAICRAALDALK
ncbi:MAG TPA: hypothetical protein VNM48_02550 [Chloroflexota bacterium]|nr:hypothetical protein [Chloroflexota bacterium]